MANTEIKYLFQLAYNSSKKWYYQYMQYSFYPQNANPSFRIINQRERERQRERETDRRTGRDRQADRQTEE